MINILSQPLGKKWRSEIVLLLACALTYWNCLNNGFLIDDYCALFSQDHFAFWDFLQLSPRSFAGHILFRPVSQLLNVITYHLFHSWGPGYHLLSLLLFWLGAVVLRRVLLALFSDGPWALLAAMLFCVHPINGILVNYKNATGFPFMVLSMNLGLLFFLKWEEKTREDFSPHRGNGYLISSFIFFILALLCHEVVVVFPLYLLAVLCFARGYPLSRAIVKVVPFLVFVGLYAIFRSTFMSLPETLAGSLPRLQLTFLTYVASLAKLAAWYVAKLFTLQGIVFIWDTVPTVKNAYLWAGGLLLALLGVGGSIAKGWVKKKEALMLCWGVIGLLPVGLACLTRADFGFYIEPHWLPYTAVAFVSLAASVLCYVKRFLREKIWLTAVALIVLTNILFSFSYNYLWGNQKRYCLYWQEIAPRNYWVNYWLGLTYLHEGNTLLAKHYYERLSSQGFERWDVLGNLGIVELKLKNYDAALQYFLRSEVLMPHQAKTSQYIEKIRKILRQREEVSR